jgi:hypothetical protein
MDIPDYLLASKVADAPIDYKWTVDYKNRFLTADADTKPQLSNAVAAMSGRAAFAFGVASAEWVVARLSKHMDTSEVLRRIEAAWAATVDARYARFPRPGSPDKSIDYTIVGPIYFVELMLFDMHNRYLSGDQGKVYMDAVVLAMLAEHVAGRNAGFKKWAPEVLKSGAANYPTIDKPIADQPPVVRELFEPSDGSASITVTSSQAQWLADLDPAANPYLVPANELVNQGIGKPYSGKA